MQPFRPAAGREQQVAELDHLAALVPEPRALGVDLDHLVAEPHVHEVPEIYLLFAPTPGAAVIEVEVEGETYELKAPAALYVPKGQRHRFIELPGAAARLLLAGSQGG